MEAMAAARNRPDEPTKAEEEIAEIEEAAIADEISKLPSTSGLAPVPAPAPEPVAV
jgi:hypothetical protein